MKRTDGQRLHPSPSSLLLGLSGSCNSGDLVHSANMLTALEMTSARLPASVRQCRAVRPVLSEMRPHTWKLRDILSTLYQLMVLLLDAIGLQLDVAGSYSDHDLNDTHMVMTPT